MNGPTTGPTSLSDPRPSASERAAAERVASAVQRPQSQPRLFHSTQPKGIGRRIHTPMLRHMPRLPQRPSETVNAAADKALDVSTKAIGARPSHSSAPKPWPLLHVLGRAGRLTFDAALLIVFAPVIAIWWLTEKRHKR